MSEQQGWYPDPYRLHEWRYFSQGAPTKLVRDPFGESYDPPPGPLPASSVAPPEDLDRRSESSHVPKSGSAPVAFARIERTFLSSAWALVEERPWVLGITAAGTVVAFAIAAVVALQARGLGRHRHRSLWLVAIAVVAEAFPLVVTKGMVMLTVDHAARGQDLPVMSALKSVVGKLPQLLVWDGLILLVTKILGYLRSIPLIGLPLAVALGWSWCTAAVFVVPMVVVDDVPLAQAVPASVRAFRTQWGTRARVRVRMGRWAVLAFVVLIVVSGFASVVAGPGFALVVVIGGSFAYAVLVGTLEAILTLMLYRYTFNRVLLGGIGSADLVQTMGSRPRW